MSFRINVTNKHADPSRANYQQDEFSTARTLTSDSNDEVKVFPSSNTTFKPPTSQSKKTKGHVIRETMNCAEDYM